MKYKTGQTLKHPRLKTLLTVTITPDNKILVNGVVADASFLADTTLVSTK